ncbi:MAG TPA: allantoate amidohydrolase [Steroidobacteraceae bacterium]|nr:allantoate amidohydrolase [Steroidobacteraceae bacterium]
MTSVSQLNAMSVPEFVGALQSIWERSPWIPERTAGMRPFRSVLDLHAAMRSRVLAASLDDQLALIRAHPQLAGRAAAQGELTPDSSREQHGAGLDACSPEELARLTQLNSSYVDRFGFPFVLAVKGHNRSSILKELERRVGNALDAERMEALQQISRIAAFRLTDLLEEEVGVRIHSMAEHLALISESDDALTCSYLTPAHRATAAQIRDWMLASGLTVEMDAVGNVIGRLQGTSPDAGTLLTGSHYDTVVNAGKYDGRLGILLPIAVVSQMRRAGRQLPYTLEIIAFAEEEGVRFKSTFLGSCALAGRFDPALLDSVDANGISLRDAMREADLEPDPQTIASAALDPGELLGFAEVHIEQGPTLLEANRALGVVTSIAGSIRSIVSVTGIAGHSGTVPMQLRRDAAAGAAEMVLAVEKRCQRVPGLVGTVGQLNVPGGAINVIPGRCEFSVDIRSGTDSIRDAAFSDVQSECEQIGARRGLGVEWRKVLEINSVPCANKMQRRWADSIQKVTGVEPLRLPSGAGHDAMVMAELTEVGMLFVRCGHGGISHSPLETLSEADTALAARAFREFLLSFTP